MSDIHEEPSRCPPPGRLLVAISGASGVIYGIRLLQALQETDLETHLIMSRSAEVTLAHETGMKAAGVRALADAVHAVGDLGGAPASGSFRTRGMIVAPCSMRSLAEIAGGNTTSLLTRAADVTLKERRPLVLMARETPLHAGHLRNMLQVTELGAIVAPPVPAFYAKPDSIGDLVDHSVGRVLDLFGIDSPLVQRWGENTPQRAAPKHPTQS